MISNYIEGTVKRGFAIMRCLNGLMLLMDSSKLTKNIFVTLLIWIHYLTNVLIKKFLK